MFTPSLTLKDDLAGLCRAFAPWADAVLKRRWRLVAELSRLLARTGFRFEVDENAFMQNRLYAAVVLQHQSRITCSLQQITQDRQSWSRLQQRCSGFWLPDASETMCIVRGDEIEAALHWPHAPLQTVDLAFQERLRATGFTGLVGCGTGLVVIDRLIDGDEPVRNHSDDFHLFTVHTDLVADRPVKTAEAIVHENGHNLLNLFLEANQIVLATEELAHFSPWTQSLRHDRGIVHAFFVFALVVQYYVRLRELGGPEEGLTRYIELQMNRLADTAPLVRRILARYPTALATLVEHVYSQLPAPVR